MDIAETETIPRFSVDDARLRSAPPSAPNGQLRPTTRGAKLVRSGDGRVTMGLWDCEAGVFDVKFLCDEAVHILEGEVIVRTGRSTQTLRAGDVALFRTGLTTTWEVPRYVRKLWFHHIPKPTIAERVKYKLRLVLGLIEQPRYSA